ncbi:hypothetical protein, partial [Escherichia sp. MOD1-EC5948]|uniref:hypothetical protein n=1 Tax=Escherichia sp. MOD1-EC5948 TaxID=2093877 RepID=UPI001F30491B
FEIKLNGADFFFFSKHVLSPESPGNHPHPQFTIWIVRSTQHVVSLRFSHQKGHQHAEQRGLLHDKANAPAGRVHCR